MPLLDDDFGRGSMKVVIERSGGFAGLKRRGELEGAALTAEQHAALRDVLRRDQSALSSEPGADRFVFKITVEDESGSKTISVSESNMPSVLAKIVN